MQCSLVRHPQSPVGPIEGIEASLAASGRHWLVEYRVRGAIDAIVVPARVSEPRFTDELWRTTCFEAFVGGDGAAYTEYNFSPSGAWAAYRFADYRAETTSICSEPPKIVTHRADDALVVTAALGPPKGTLGLSVVIEARDGSKSYWALAHPPGAPDFHHRDCFALTLPPRTRA